MKKYNLILFVFMILSPLLYGQSGRDSLSFVRSNFAGQRLSSSFDKQLNTYHLNTGFTFSHKAGNFFAGVKEDYRSSLVKSSSPNIRDAQYLSFIGEYTFAQKVSLGLLTSNELFSDDRRLAINEAATTYSSVFARFTPYRNIKLIPFGGVSVNRQVGTTDEGYIYGSEALIDNINFSDVDISSSLKFQNEDISPRKNTLRLFNLELGNKFEDSFVNNISASYSEQRRDFYTEADSITNTAFDVANNIQSRTESNYYVNDRIIFFPASGEFNLELQGGINWRNIDRATRYITTENISSSSFDTKIDELRLIFASVANIDYGIFDGNLRLEFNEREERHTAKPIENVNEIFFREKEDIEKRKNNKSQIQTVSASGRLDLGKKDKLYLSLYHRKLRYDTPSEENFDDRDELLSIFRMRYDRELNPWFNLFFNLEGSLKHLVYIFSERSSNNNIQRVLKFSSGSLFESRKLVSSNQAEVSANYTVYDFENLGSGQQSFAFRQFSFRDSTAYYFTPLAGISLIGYIKLSEQGDFDWGNFSGRPSRFLNEKYLEPKLFRILNRGGIEFRFAAGIRYYSLTTFSYNSDLVKEKESVYSSYGPIAEIGILLPPRLTVKCEGYYESISNENNERNDLVSMNLRIMWNF